MTDIVVKSSATAQWQSLVSEAAGVCAASLDEDLESYLVFLLMRFARQPEMAASIMAVDYLKGMQAGGQQSIEQLRDVGDKCLLYSGLYPKRAQRRRVPIRYFVDIGRASYRQIGDSLQKSMAQIYARLSHSFIELMDILQAMKDINGQQALDPLTLCELVDDCGSRQARRTLSEQFGIEHVSGCGKKTN